MPFSGSSSQVWPDCIQFNCVSVRIKGKKTKATLIYYLPHFAIFLLFEIIQKKLQFHANGTQCTNAIMLNSIKTIYESRH